MKGEAAGAVEKMRRTRDHIREKIPNRSAAVSGVLRLNWPGKILLYSVMLVVASVSLTALATVRTASHLWEQEFLGRNTAYANYTSLEVLRTFGGRFSGGTDPAMIEAVRELTRSNQDLLGVQILTESGRILFSGPAGGEEERERRTAAERVLAGDGAWYEGADRAVRSVTGSSQPVARTFSVNGERYLDVLAPVTGLGGSRPIAVRYLYGYSSLEEKTANLIRRVLLTAVGLMALVAGLSAFFARALTRPVSMLSESARRIAEGDRDHRIHLKTGDEIEDLSERFNQMLESLAEHRQDLEDANRELREANVRLTELQAQLVRSEMLAALGQLSAGVSHELDNPVGVILGYAELVVEESPPESPLREYGTVLRDEAKRCKRIIAGLLDFSRPSRGIAEPLEVGDLVRDLTAQLKEQRSFRNLAWDLDLGDGAPVVTADRDSLRQILVNLALNAAQAMGETGAIAIRLEDLSAETPAGCRITFTDTGEGIPEAMVERVFDPFYTTKRRGEGTGLGLSICRKLVEEMGGWIRAAPGPGGRFEVWLPAAGGAVRQAAKENRL